MPEKIEKATKIACKECGYDNESQRVYCHNCGVKLDRSVLPKSEAKNASEKTRQKTLKTVRKASGKYFSFTHEVLNPLVKVVVFSAMTASIIEMVRLPDDVPAKAAPSGSLPFIVQDMDAMLAASEPLKRDYTQAQVNEYLKNTVKSKGGMMGDTIKFERVFVVFYKENVCRFGVEQSIGFSKDSRWPLYATSLYVPDKSGNKVIARNVGGHIGRLPIHPSLMPSISFLYAKVWASLSKEFKKMELMDYITVGEKEISLVSKPGSAPSLGGSAPPAAAEAPATPPPATPPAL